MMEILIEELRLEGCAAFRVPGRDGIERLVSLVVLLRSAEETWESAAVHLLPTSLREVMHWVDWHAVDGKIDKAKLEVLLRTPEHEEFRHWVRHNRPGFLLSGGAPLLNVDDLHQTLFRFCLQRGCLEQQPDCVVLAHGVALPVHHSADLVVSVFGRGATAADQVLVADAVVPAQDISEVTCTSRIELQWNQSQQLWMGAAVASAACPAGKQPTTALDMPVLVIQHRKSRLQGASAREQAASGEVEPALPSSSTKDGVPTQKLVEAAKLLAFEAKVNAPLFNVLTEEIATGRFREQSWQVYRQCDSGHRGFLAWETGEVQEFVFQVFQRYGLQAPTPELIRSLASSMLCAWSPCLETRGCLDLAESLVRAIFHKRLEAQLPPVPSNPPKPKPPSKQSVSPRSSTGGEQSLAHVPLSKLQLPGFDPKGRLQSGGMPPGIGEHTVLDVLNLFLDGVAEQLEWSNTEKTPTADGSPTMFNGIKVGHDTNSIKDPGDEISARKQVTASGVEPDEVLFCIRTVIQRLLRADWETPTIEPLLNDSSETKDLASGIRAYVLAHWQILRQLWDAKLPLEIALSEARDKSRLSSSRGGRDLNNLAWPEEAMTQRMREELELLDALQGRAAQRRSIAPDAAAEAPRLSRTAGASRHVSLAGGCEFVPVPTASSEASEESSQVSETWEASNPLEFAECWVNDYVPQPLSDRVSYPCGTQFSFQENHKLFFPIALANGRHRQRMMQTISNRGFVEVLLQIFSTCDKTQSGSLGWRKNGIFHFVDAAFKHHALRPPSEEQARKIFMLFDRQRSNSLEARECLCLVDAMLRSICALELPASKPGRRALTLAEQWANSRSAKPMIPASSYPNGVTVDFSDFAPTLAKVAAANAHHWAKAVRAVESGSLAPRALRTYRQHDRNVNGYLEWNTGEVHSFAEAVFQQHVLVPPAEFEVREVFYRFAGEAATRLEARECLCLVDILFRSAFHPSNAPRSTARRSVELELFHDAVLGSAPKIEPPSRELMDGMDPAGVAAGAAMATGSSQSTAEHGTGDTGPTPWTQQSAASTPRTLSAAGGTGCAPTPTSARVIQKDPSVGFAAVQDEAGGNLLPESRHMSRTEDLTSPARLGASACSQMPCSVSAPSATAGYCSLRADSAPQTCRGASSERYLAGRSRLAPPALWIPSKARSTSLGPPGSCSPTATAEEAAWGGAASARSLGRAASARSAGLMESLSSPSFALLQAPSSFCWPLPAIAPVVSGSSYRGRSVSPLSMQPATTPGLCPAPSHVAAPRRRSPSPSYGGCIAEPKAQHRQASPSSLVPPHGPRYHGHMSPGRSRSLNVPVARSPSPIYRFNGGAALPGSWSAASMTVRSGVSGPSSPAPDMRGGRC
mmetsp:Transcript_30005/g.69844  ORF Transcript_30005/g.69844 Transcript_30005/m.69844 type:complete len:1374 (+) Transcript_30005:38-4159(+)